MNIPDMILRAARDLLEIDEGLAEEYRNYNAVDMERLRTQLHDAEQVDHTLPIVASGYVKQVHPAQSRAESYLNAIDLALLDARAALADEHEGKFTEAVGQLDAMSTQLNNLVAGW